MKKNLIILISILLIICAFVVYFVINYRNMQMQAQINNKEYNTYKDKTIVGTTLVSIINKTVDNNEKNNIEKDNSNVYVDLNQSQNELLALKKLLSKENIKKGNAEVTLTLSDNSIYPYKGILQLQEINVDENTGTVTLRAEFPNNEGLLLSGMFVRATIQSAVDSKAFLLPQQAVSRDSKANPIITIVNEDNSTKKQQIIIDRAIENYWLVTSGITSNDKIIIEGLNKINPKSIVKPIDVTSKYLKKD